MMRFKAIVFDMDGTIVNSYLNFSKIREEIGIDSEVGILEYIDELLDKKDIDYANKIVHDHEMEGAKKSVLMRDFKTFYNELKNNLIPTGLLTRNSKFVTEYTLKKHGLDFDIVLTRDCCRPKPDPEGLIIAANNLNVSTEDLLYVGDYLFDLDTARNANAKSALILNDRNFEFIDSADLSFKEFKELSPYIF